MAYTQADLDRINKAITNGTLSVEIEGKKITYRSMTDLMVSKSMIESELAQLSGSSVIRQTVASFRRD